MNFYEKAYNQRLYNRGALFSYIAGYMYFINTPESLASSDNNWYKRYLNTNKVDKKAGKNVKLDNLKPNNIALNY